MNLLLLLSALFSALTGVGSVARRPDVAQAVTQVAAVAEAAATAVAAAGVRPVAVLPSRRTVAAMRMVPAVVLRTIPFWADRRRE